MTPKKYPENLHTQKIFIFWNPPKILKFKILTKKWPEPTYVWKYQSTPVEYPLKYFSIDERIGAWNVADAASVVGPTGA